MKRCLMTLFWVALAVSGVLAQDKKTVPPPPKPTDGEPNALPPTQSQLVQLASKIVPSLVAIYVDSATQSALSTSQGDHRSGVILDAKGYILTNRHLIDKADHIRVKLQSDVPGVLHDARLIGTDSITDLAVIKIDTDLPLTAATLANSDMVRLGDWLLAVGFRPDMKAGIVTGKGHNVYPGMLQPLIRIDATIERQDSGDAVVDMTGHVVGISDELIGANSRIGGLVLPANVVALTYNQLIGPQHRVVRGSIGVMFSPDQGTNSKNGVLLTEVVSGGPADQAGLKKGDILLSISGKMVRNSDDFLDVLPFQKPGSRVAVTFRRDSSNLSPSNTPSASDGPLSGIRVKHAEGFWAELGLEAGDTVLEVNRQSVSSEEQFRTLLAPLKGRDVVLRVKHQTQVTFVAGTLDVDPETAMAQIQFVSAPPDAESKHQQTQSKDGMLETEVLVADSAKLFASPLNLDGPPPQNPADDEPGFCLATTAVSTKSAPQKAVPPPPKTTDDGPSLEVTMKFVQDKLNQEGSVSYIESYRNSITGEQGGPWKHSFASSVEEVYPSGGLSLKTVHSWPMAGHRDTFTHRLCFKEVEKLEVLSMAEYANREATKKGNPELVYQYDPPAYELVIHMTSGKTLPTHVQRVKGDSAPIEETEESTAEIDLPFPDEDTANRLAKAMVYAVELCGGGSKPEPF